jgi:hypothetical protein
VKIYAVAVVAARMENGKLSMKLSAIGVPANNEEDAIEMALLYLQLHYPEVDGWHSHSGHVTELEKNWILDNLAAEKNNEHNGN